MQQQERRSILLGECRPVAEDVLVHGVFTERDVLVHGVFSERASHRQDVGVHDNAGFTSYLSLDQLSNAAARRLLELLRLRRSRDLEKFRRIVIDVEPGRRLVVILLAVIKLGLAYVPVDSRSAANRVKYILQVCVYIYTCCRCRSRICSTYNIILYN